MNLKKATLIICVVWISIISIWVIRNEIILHNGREVLLKTVPVDPRDILMGDYVILNYEIGQMNLNNGSNYAQVFSKSGQKRYVSVGKYELNKQVYTKLSTDENDIAYIEEVYDKKPNNNHLYLKGKMSKCDTVNPLWKNGKCIKYGIESYYVKEKTGLELEKNLRNGTLVKVSIDRNGNAKVKGFVSK